MTDNKEVTIVEQQEVAPAAPAQQDQTTAVIQMIERAATNPDVDMDKMERLLDMQERIMNRQAETEFNAALAEMQDDVPEITETGQILNKQGNVQSTYATFEDINREVKPILKQHGFAMSFRTDHQEGMIIITGVLTHRAGHREQTSIHLPQDSSGSKNNVQGVGSSVSYGKRYTMGALLNITTRGQDDDAQTAVPEKTITAAQAEAITKALGGGERVAAFCKSAKIGCVQELAAKHFDEAMARIRKSNEGNNNGNS